MYSLFYSSASCHHTNEVYVHWEIPRVSILTPGVSRLETKLLISVINLVDIGTHNNMWVCVVYCFVLTCSTICAQPYVLNHMYSAICVHLDVMFRAETRILLLLNTRTPETSSDSDEQKEENFDEDLSHLIPSHKGSRFHYKDTYYESKRGCYRTKHGSEVATKPKWRRVNRVIITWTGFDFYHITWSHDFEHILVSDYWWVYINDHILVSTYWWSHVDRNNTVVTHR